MIDKGPSKSGAQDPLDLASSQSSQEPSALRGDIPKIKNEISQLTTNDLSIKAIKYIWTLQGSGLVVLVFLSFFPRLFHIQEYAFFSLLTLAILCNVFTKKSLLIQNSLNWPIIAFLLWVGLTIPISSINPPYSFQEWCKLLARFLVYFGALNVFDTIGESKTLKNIVIALMAGAGIMGCYGIYNFYQEGGSLTDRGIRAIAPFSHSHWLATYMVLSLPFFGLSFLFFERVLERALIAIGMAMVVIAEFLAYSRAGWLGMAFQMIIGGYILARHCFVKIMAVIICLALFLWMISSFGYVGGIFEAQSVNDRLGCWELGLEELIKHPLTGIGYGNDIFRMKYPGDPPGPCTGGHLHNTYLMYAIGTGLPGLALFILILSLLFQKMFNGFLDSNLSKLERCYCLALLVALVGYSVALAFNYLFTGSLAYLFCLLAGVGMSLTVRPRSNRVNEKGSKRLGSDVRLG